MKSLITKVISISLLMALPTQAAEKKRDTTPKNAGKVEEKKTPVQNSVYGTDLPLKSGSMITIKSYDDKTRTFQIEATNFPGEGPSDITPEGLAKAVKATKLDRLKSNPNSIVGNEFKLDAELPTLFDEEKAARAK